MFADFYEPPLEIYTTTLELNTPSLPIELENEVIPTFCDVDISLAPQVWQFDCHESVAVDNRMREDFAATWDDSVCCEHEPVEYTAHGQPFFRMPATDAPSGPPGREEPVDMLFLDADVVTTQPEVVFVTDPLSGETVPMATALMLVSSVQGKSTARIFRVLFDSGGTSSMAHKRVCPPGTNVTPKPARQVNTLAGHMTSAGTIQIDGMRLPEFDRNRVIDSHEFGVFDAPCQYDLILGSEFLTKMGIRLDYQNLQVDWLGISRPMNTNKFTHERRRAMVDAYLLHLEEDDELDDLACYATAVMDAKYEAIEADDIIAKQCSHLTEEQQNDLRALFSERGKLFDGTLGKFAGAPMHIELEDNVRPVYRRPYPVPHSQLETFRKELHHLVELGVLSRCGESQWALPTFIVAKKPLPGETEGRVRWVSDFRELNKVIKPVNYTLPIITDILRKHHGYQFFSKLDISMQYYTFELTEEAKNLCVISTPFGNYKYNRAPMGLCNSPAFAQARMEEVLRDIDETDVYIDDVGVFTSTWERHVQVLKVVLERLESHGFTVNPLKCEWAVKETDWLGYWVTPSGLKPWKKKVDAILKLKPPRNASEVRSFLGMINFYRDMWPRRTELLKQFNALSGGPKHQKVEWTPALEAAFHEVKAIIAQDALMAFPNHNRPFEIYTDASDYQLGACIMQEGRPVAYYSKKLSGAQRNYTTMEKELLAIVMTLKEFRSMLLGAEITIYTDHRNLTFDNFSTQRVLRWRCFIEEYAPKMVYLPGKMNTLADAFSRLPRFDVAEVAEGKTELPTKGDNSLFYDDMFSLVDDPELAHCLMWYSNMDEALESYVNLPATAQNPLRLEWLKAAQDNDAGLQQRLTNDPQHFRQRVFQGTNLICHVPNPHDDSQWSICLSDSNVDATIEFMHNLLNHPSHNILLKGLRLYHHPQLSARVKQFHCDVCQRVKSGVRGYGHFPPRQVTLLPWEQNDVDLIGPWRIEVGGTRAQRNSYEFYALTCIDRVIGFPDAVRIDRKTSAHVADKYKEVWLSRYPRPVATAHDLGGEFIGPEFQNLLHDFAISDLPTTSRNPTANGIVERMHLTIGNVLRALTRERNPKTLQAAKDMMDSAIATAMHAVRTNVSESTQNSPGALAFRRDMLHNIPVSVDLPEIQQRRQAKVDADLLRINSKRYSHDYSIGEQVLKRIHDPIKLEDRWEGPFLITCVHSNGNVTMKLRPGISERINIRRIKPYREPAPSVLTAARP